MAENKKYGTIPARLGMNAIRTHGIEPVDFEWHCIAAVIHGLALVFEATV